MKKRKKNLRQILIPAFIITACIPLAIFALISQERLKTSTLENMNNQAEADLQKANQSLNMTLDKYETLLYAITTDEEFLSLVVNANDSEEIPEADAYNMRRDFSHICNRNEGVDGIQLVLSDKRRIFYDRLSSSSVNSTWMEKVKFRMRQSCCPMMLIKIRTILSVCFISGERWLITGISVRI